MPVKTEVPQQTGESVALQISSFRRSTRIAAVLDSVEAKYATTRPPGRERRPRRASTVVDIHQTPVQPSNLQPGEETTRVPQTNNEGTNKPGEAVVFSGNAIEVGRLQDGTVVVQEQNRPQTRLEFTPEEWDAFVKGVKNGEFDFGLQEDTVPWPTLDELSARYGIPKDAIIYDRVMQGVPIHEPRHTITSSTTIHYDPEQAHINLHAYKQIYPPGIGRWRDRERAIEKTEQLRKRKERVKPVLFAGTEYTHVLAKQIGVSNQSAYDALRTLPGRYVIPGYGSVVPTEIALPVLYEVKRRQEMSKTQKDKSNSRKKGTGSKNAAYISIATLSKETGIPKSTLNEYLQFVHGRRNAGRNGYILPREQVDKVLPQILQELAQEKVSNRRGPFTQERKRKRASAGTDELIISDLLAQFPDVHPDRIRRALRDAERKKTEGLIVSKERNYPTIYGRAAVAVIEQMQNSHVKPGDERLTREDGSYITPRQLAAELAARGIQVSESLIRKLCNKAHVPAVEGYQTTAKLKLFREDVATQIVTNHMS